METSGAGDDPAAGPHPVAVVTGAGSGIGREVTRALLARGYRVALAGRREDALDETLDGHAPEENRGIVVPTDVADHVAVEELFDRVRSRWNRVDLLFNNAGVFGPTVPLDELPVSAWQAVVATNLGGAFLCAQAAFRVMRHQRPRGGRIINNGSVSAHTPRPQQAAYTATKHAITGLTKALSLEGRAHDIAAGQIDIGNARTALLDGISSGALQADGTVAVEPMMDVQHAVDAVLFMASLPLDANVQFLVVTATRMPYIGRG